MSSDSPAALRPIIAAHPPGPWLQLFEQRGFHWSRVELPVPRLPAALDGLRILHIADVHFNRRWTPSHDRLLQLTADEKPDLILLTGDLIDRKYNQAADVPLVKRLAAGLSAPLGVFTILGNHDGSLLAPHFRDSGMRLIDGNIAAIESAGVTIELIGLPGVDRIDLSLDWLAAIPKRLPDVLRIVLSHFPDRIRFVDSLQADVVLAGHTHGGQVCLPGSISLVRHDALPRIYCSGVHRWADSWLVVSRGFGFAGVPIRLFCPAEVMVLTLRRA